jgi:hypothetical protein
MLLPALVVLALIGCQTGVSGQDRDRPEDAKTGRLAGRVIASDTSRPIMRAQVALIRVSETRPFVFAFTNDVGGYAFEQVPQGRYTLVAHKPGSYLETLYGRTTPETLPKVLTIAAGSETRIDIALPRASAISGRIFDESGEPLPYATVVLIRPPGTPTPPSEQQTNPAPLIVSSVPGSTNRVWAQPGAMTNDRGEFRLFGLGPGEYLLYANPHMLPGDKRRHAPVYYPGVVDSASAERIRVLPGQEIVNLDFTLKLMQRLTVSGVALTPDGDPVRGGNLALHVAGFDNFVLSQIGSIKVDGSFSFEMLPGQYVLRARHFNASATPDDRNQSLSVASPLAVGSEDISGLVLRLTRGAGIGGEFVFEGSSRPPDVSRFSVRVPSGGPGEVVVGKPRPDGTFLLYGIESGSRRVSAAAPAGWMLRGIYLNGRDIADQAVDFADDTIVSGVSVVFTDVITRVRIGVRHTESDSTAVVLVFPDDLSLANDRRIAVRAATAETLTIDGLPRGEYLAVAVSDGALGSLERPDAKLLERLRPAAQRFEIADGASVSVTLRAVPLPR